MILGCEVPADFHCELHSLEVLVSNGTQLNNSSCAPAAHFGVKCGGRWRVEHWCETKALPSEPGGISKENAKVRTFFEYNEGYTGNGRAFCLDTEGITLYIDLPFSSRNDSAAFVDREPVQHISAATGPTTSKEGIALLPALPTRVGGGGGGSHEEQQLKMTSQAEAPHQILETEIPATVLRAFLLNDANVPRFKRWRQVTPIDHTPDCGSYVLKKPEIVPSVKMPTPPPKEELLLESSVKAGLAPAESQLREDSDHEPQNCNQRESPSPLLIVAVEKTESKIPPTHLGSHALRALLEADDVQKLKRRRLTTPADSGLPLKELKSLPETNSVDVLSSKQSGALLVVMNDIDPETSPVSDVLSITPVSRSLADESEDGAREDNARDVVGSGGDGPPEMASTPLKGRTESASDTSSGSHDNSPLDKYISRPSRFSGGGTEPPALGSSKKKEWLAGQHHGGGGAGSGEGDTRIVQDLNLNLNLKMNLNLNLCLSLSFAKNVGSCYRDAIDIERPGAEHPGFVGDKADVQCCRICEGREDASSSLICDSCDGVFHMSCVNARMKIVPRVDEWLCRPCKKKRKMSREKDEQGESDHGEPKDWWREDTVIGRVERELLRMSNGRRVRVRIGPKYQADVPEWAGVLDEVDLHDNLAETSYRFGKEVAQSDDQKQMEQDVAEYNLARNVWPLGWVPATQLPPNYKENWVQCTIVLFDKGEICPDGRRAEKDIICGKWRRAPLHIVQNDEWECSCALVWDPRHADCAVPQELPTEEIMRRMQSFNLVVQPPPIYAVV